MNQHLAQLKIQLKNSAAILSIFRRGAFFNPIIQGTGEPACRIVPSTTPRKYQLKQERVTWKSFSFIKGKSILLATRT